MLVYRGIAKEDSEAEVLANYHRPWKLQMFDGKWFSYTQLVAGSMWIGGWYWFTVCQIRYNVEIFARVWTGGMQQTLTNTNCDLSGFFKNQNMRFPGVSKTGIQLALPCNGENEVLNSWILGVQLDQCLKNCCWIMKEIDTIRHRNWSALSFRCVLFSILSSCSGVDPTTFQKPPHFHQSEFAKMPSKYQTCLHFSSGTLVSFEHTITNNKKFSSIKETTSLAGRGGGVWAPSCTLGRVTSGLGTYFFCWWTGCSYHFGPNSATCWSEFFITSDKIGKKNRHQIVPRQIFRRITSCFPLFKSIYTVFLHGVQWNLVKKHHVSVAAGWKPRWVARWTSWRNPSRSRPTRRRRRLRREPWHHIVLVGMDGRGGGPFATRTTCYKRLFFFKKHK